MGFLINFAINLGIWVGFLFVVWVAFKLAGGKFDDEPNPEIKEEETKHELGYRGSFL